MNDLHDPETYRIDGMHSGLGARLMLSYFTRLECGICGPKPLPGRRFTDSVWIEAGYSIDAPESMPAGGMRTFMIADDPDPIPEQMTVDRE
jgi:hypothetical protein